VTDIVLDPWGEQWTQSASGLVLPAQPKRLTAVDLFCGCGGFSLGIIEAGFEVLCGVDWAEDAAVSYMMNLGTYPIDLRCVEESDRERMEKHLRRGMRRKPSEVVSACTSGSNRPADRPGVPVFWLGDARKLTGRQILDSIGLDVGELDLLFGGPPCQGFSVAGKRNVMDPRNSLVFEFARLVCEMRPRALCMENVPGMLSMVTPEGVPVMDELCSILERGDYGEHEALVRMLTGERRMARRGMPKHAVNLKAASTQGELFARGGPL
jgi:DNA (cytosine-5)-methyltransferase 1